MSPLARCNDRDPSITDRFELIIGGREFANGFSELNDAEDQAQRFREQAAARAAGDSEAMFYDADYVRALEYGLPPSGGLPACRSSGCCGTRACCRSSTSCATC